MISAPLQRWLLLPFLALQCAAAPLDLAHWLLQVGEELHRTFQTRRLATILQATASEGRLCARQLRSNISSRKHYEDSWTGVRAPGSLEAVFNGTCFTRVAGACEPYRECLEPTQRYPSELTPMGALKFLPEATALEGIHWAASQASVEAWQREQVALQAELASSPDDASERAQYIRGALTGAAGSADAALRVGAQSLLELAKARVAAFKRFVVPATGPVPVQDSPALPASLEALASAEEALVAAAESDPCSGHDWSTLLERVRTELGAHSGTVGGINASALLQPPAFDYTRRAVEALAVGASLALQTGAVAVLAEFGCEVLASPRTALVRDLDGLRESVHSLLGEVSAALPVPSDGRARIAPLQACLSGRVGAAASAVSSTASTEGSARPLLSLDFCGRLFDASTDLLLQVVPYSEAAPSALSMSFSSASGEERTIHFSNESIFAYIRPYVDIVARGVDDPLAFADGDKVLSLRAMADDNVHAAGTTPLENMCSAAQANALMAQGIVECDSFDFDQSPCTVRGCRRLGYYCFPAKAGFYTPDGQNELACPTDGLQVPDEALFYASAWHNETCPFVCQKVDTYQSGRTCKVSLDGFYSPVCNNDLFSCDIPSGMPESLFCSLAQFTSTGYGSSDGCEVTLSSPLALPTSPEPLMPPLTVELWLKVSAADLPSSHAVLMGIFPQWFMAMRRASSLAVQIGFYHHRITRAVSSREDSIVYSSPIAWGSTWRHIAVVVTSKDASTPNVHFYCDGELVSQAQRSTVEVPFPQVHPCQRDTFHIGPPNARLSPEVLLEGRTEPYFNIPGSELFYAAQIDEVRVSRAALDGLTQGAQLTELHRLAACNMPFERLDGGSTCQPVARLTQGHAQPDQSSCVAGFEMCGSRPGLCVAECVRGTLRQPDCTCDCPPGKFQAWYVQALHLTGSGAVGGVVVYDSSHNVAAQSAGATLPLRIDLSPAVEVAVLSVRGVGSAQAVWLDIETPTGVRKAVPELANIPLYTDRDTILHHRRVDEFSDPSLSCAVCPGDLGLVLGSQLPRTDSLACQCTAGRGRNLLGRCVPVREPPPSPSIEPQAGFHTAGTRVRLVPPAFEGEAPWLLEVRYTLATEGAQAAVPTCQSSALYSEEDDGSGSVGLDIVRPRARATVCAVTCHPMHLDSLMACAEFTGNDHMNPPRCILNGTLSTVEAYALEVGIDLAVDGQPDATIHYRLAGSSQFMLYGGSFTVTAPGLTRLEVQAEKTGFDPSATATCQFTIEGPPRLAVVVVWPEEEDPTEEKQLGGFVHSEGAFLVKRFVDKLRFKLLPQLPASSDPPLQVDVQYRTAHGSAPAGPWHGVAADGSMALDVQESLEAPLTNTVLRVEWRAKEPGYVWTVPAGAGFLLVAAQEGSPTVEAAPSAPWSIGDSWFPGPRREAALRQVHRVELHPPTATARLLFALGPWEQQPLLRVSEANVSSLHNQGLVPHFRSLQPSTDWSPDVLLERCSPEPGVVDMPTLCDYLSPFEVVAGTQVTAFALDHERLESLAATTTIPREQEPPSDDPRFEASVGFVGPRVSIQGLPDVFVLPSAASSLAFSLGPEGAERQSCVLVSQFAHHSDPQGSVPQLDDCAWLAYNSMRRLPLLGLLEAAGLAAQEEPASLNVTVLTTVRQPGFLWAYPRAVTFLWLRERTPPPSIVGVIEPGPTALVSAMVWLQSETAGAGSGLAPHLQDGGTGVAQPRCYFTLRSIPVDVSELPEHWLAAVPERTLVVQGLRDAVLPTEERLAAHALSAWQDDLRLCTWPGLCELPLNGTLPAALIQTPADIPQLCTWALWHGYGTSLPECRLMGPQARAKQARLEFTLEGNLSQQFDSGEDFTKVHKVGFDEELGATIVVFRESAAGVGQRRLADGSTSRHLAGAQLGLPLFLERTHPLQYRYAAVPFDLAHAAHGVDELVSSSDFSNWHSLDVADSTPVVPLPGGLQVHEHALVEVEVRLLIGIGRWGQQSRNLCIVLQGSHPEMTVQQLRRGANLSSSIADSTILYRWTLSEPQDLKAENLLRLQEGSHAVATAYALDAAVQSQVMPSGTPSQQCVAQEEVPLLCASEGPLELYAPDARRWGLWAAAFAPGLLLSPTVQLVVEAQCAVPSDIAFAGFPPCAEGTLIDTGSTCSPRCLEGYAASAASRECADGNPDSVAFTCEEAPCASPVNITFTGDMPCSEGEVLASGGVCTPSCAEGHIPSEPSLSCRLGQLTPSTFACVEAPCTAPTSVVHAADPSCSGLKEIASGSACIPQCQSGYTASQPQLQCFKGALSPSTFECAEAVCAAPRGIRFASTPACIEGDVLGSGANCTPMCEHGYLPSLSILTCNKGDLSPGTFTCVEVIIIPGVITAGSLNMAPLVAGATGGVVAITCLAVVVFCWRRSLSSRAEVPEDHELKDALAEWWTCVNEVEPGICVFCGNNPVEVQCKEVDHGPETLFSCCRTCADLVLSQAHQLSSQGSEGEATDPGSVHHGLSEEQFAVAEPEPELPRRGKPREVVSRPSVQKAAPGRPSQSAANEEAKVPTLPPSMPLETAGNDAPKVQTLPPSMPSEDSHKGAAKVHDGADSPAAANVQTLPPNTSAAPDVGKDEPKVQPSLPTPLQKSGNELPQLLSRRSQTADVQSSLPRIAPLQNSGNEAADASLPRPHSRRSRTGEVRAHSSSRRSRMSDDLKVQTLPSSGRSLSNDAPKVQAAPSNPGDVTAVQTLPSNGRSLSNDAPKVHAAPSNPGDVPTVQTLPSSPRSQSIDAPKARTLPSISGDAPMAQTLASSPRSESADAPKARALPSNSGDAPMVQTLASSPRSQSIDAPKARTLPSNAGDAPMAQTLPSRRRSQTSEVSRGQTLPSSRPSQVSEAPQVHIWPPGKVSQISDAPEVRIVPPSRQSRNTWSSAPADGGADTESEPTLSEQEVFAKAMARKGMGSGREQRQRSGDRRASNAPTARSKELENL